MADDRLFDSFHVLDAPVQPDAAFAERLFEGLAADLGFRPMTRRQAFARRFTDAAPAFRLAYLAAMLALLLAAAVVVALVGARLLFDRSAADIVTASQAVQLDPPVYDMTIRADDGLIARVRTDALGAWRWDWISNREFPAGTYEVHSGGQKGIYDPASNSWSLSADDAPIPNASLLGWKLSFEPSQAGAQPAKWFTCSLWLRLADDVVAGRSAYHLACDEREFWVDQESSLLVGVLTPAGQELASMSGRATALELGPSSPPGTFALTAPPGAVTIDPNNPPASTVLSLGRPAPRLTGPTLDGGLVDTSAQAGPLVVYFWATWCEPCLGTPLTDLQAVAGRHETSVETVTVATNDGREAVKRYLDANGIRLPVIDDDTGSRFKSWGLAGVPSLVMLDPDGVVVALRAGPVSAAELEAMYTALAAGQPMPMPTPSLAPS